MATASTSTPAKRSGPASGLLPISASTLQRNAAGKDASRRSARDQGPRLKVVTRRLPPGLTQEEFYLALGEDWKLGTKKVDWSNYRHGKVSKEYNLSIKQHDIPTCLTAISLVLPNHHDLLAPMSTLPTSPIWLCLRIKYAQQPFKMPRTLQRMLHSLDRLLLSLLHTIESQLVESDAMLVKAPSIRIPISLLSSKVLPLQS